MSLELLDAIARYASPSKKHSKEFCSACPFCGGDDRFIIQPYGSRQDSTPHAFCRQCKWRGTAINLLQDKEQLSYSDAKAIIDGSKDLSEVGPGQPRYSRQAKKTTPADVVGAPVQEWQWAGKGFARMCKAALWSPVGARALQWLRERGMSDEQIDQHEFGFWPEDCMADWGLGEKVPLYRGITIPYLGQDQLWKIEIRRATHAKDQRYRTVKGSANALYGYEGLEFNGRAVMVEGVFDAVIMKQALAEAGIPGIAVVATGSTNGSYEDRYVMRLSLCERVIVAFDDDQGGNKAALWWLKRLPDSRRWAPTGGDVNEMWLKDKAALIEAVQSGFLSPEMHARLEGMETPAIEEIEEDDGLSAECCLCGKEVEYYDEYGCAWCAGCFPDLSESANIISDTLAIPPNLPTKDHDIPIPAKPLRKRRETPKPVNGCGTNGCQGLAGKDGRDATGGLWCPNCVLRRDLVNAMHAAGFPRLEYSPTHFIESGEEAARSFARSMSPMAVTMAVREMARVELQGSAL